jgi:hypothetical protein
MNEILLFFLKANGEYRVKHGAKQIFDEMFLFFSTKSISIARNGNNSALLITRMKLKTSFVSVER